MRNETQGWVRRLGVLLVLGALSVPLAGCGGDSTQTTPGGDVESAPVANPSSPDVLKPEG